MAIPTKDSLLADWSDNANTRLTAAPATYGTTAAVATQYASKHDSFMTAYNNLIAARAAGTRSESLTELKDQAKKDLLTFARPLYRQIQFNDAVTNSAKIELGVVVPDVQPSPGPVPPVAPVLRVSKVDGGLVSVAIRDPGDPDRARLPDFAIGAILMSFVGDTAPTDPSAYKMEGPVGRADANVLFPESVAPGTKVWLTCLFFNKRKQMGPACAPVSTTINYGGSMPMVG